MRKERVTARFWASMKRRIRGMDTQEIRDNIAEYETIPNDEEHPFLEDMFTAYNSELKRREKCSLRTL